VARCYQRAVSLVFLNGAEHAACGLDETTIRALWALRLRNIDLRPEVELELDYRKFRAYFGDHTRVLVLRDAAGEMQGFYAFYHREVRAGGAPRLLIHAEYGFINATHRGDLGARMAAARAVFRIVGRHPLLDKLGLFVAYPPSFVAIAHYADRIFAPRDAELGGWRREMLEGFLRDTAGADYDAEAGVVRMRTQPTARLHRPRSERGRQALAWYEERNPRWREGYALPVLVEGNARSAARGALHALGIG
jgi:hypothetical protein